MKTSEEREKSVVLAKQLDVIALDHDEEAASERGTT